jgi:AcrR family transcriptional regulator
MTSKQKSASRSPLTKDRILGAAVELADREGLGALTMRRLGVELGFEAMSLYKHVANKEEILDGMVELIVGQIEIPDPGADWREAMRQRAISAREVLSRHSWAIGLLEAGSATGPNTLRYRDAILGNLGSAGFSMENAAHAFWLLDCYVYGQVIQEVSFSTSEEMTDTVATTPDQTAMSEYRHLAAMYEFALTFGFSFDSEFLFGLDLILDGLEGLRGEPPWARRRRSE